MSVALESLYPESLEEAMPTRERVDEVAASLKKAGVEFVLSCWIDLLGIPKTKPVPLWEFEELCRGRGPMATTPSTHSKVFRFCAMSQPQWTSWTGDSRTSCARGAYSQFELDYHYSDALEAADRFTFLRVMLKEIAKQHGLVVTYMPKPQDGDWRNGAHINHSLTPVDDRSNNLFCGRRRRVGRCRLSRYRRPARARRRPYGCGLLDGELLQGPHRHGGRARGRQAFTAMSQARFSITTLLEATQEFQGDALAKEVVGETMHTLYAKYQLNEWHRFHERVTEWERSEYLRFF